MSSLEIQVTAVFTVTVMSSKPMKGAIVIGAIEEPSQFLSSNTLTVYEPPVRLVSV